MINKSWRSLLDCGFALLSPKSSLCYACQRPFRRVRDSLPLLCQQCGRLVPWIHSAVCPVCGRGERCDDCARRAMTFFVCNRSAVHYNEQTREWIARYKYRGDEALAALFGTILNYKFRHMIGEMRARQAGFHFHAIIPVPLSEERLLERGFNQAEQLAAAVAGKQRIKLTPLLLRNRHSDKQSSKTRRERMDNTYNLFAVHEEWMAKLMRNGQPSPVRLLIVDDIYTTGSTVNACAAAITNCIRHSYPTIRAEIYVLTLARS